MTARRDARTSTTGKRPRQADIARLAGVSQGTVSLIVNGRSDVQIAEETRQRVLDAVEQLGYAVNPAARSLAGGSNRLLGVYTFEAMFPVDHHDFYYPFLVGIEGEAAERGWDLLLFTSATAEDGRRSMYQGNVNRLRMADGCILLGKHSRAEELSRLVREGVPFVYIGRREVPDTPIDYVAADYAAATRDLVARLASLGHRRIAYLPGATAIEPTEDRDAGYWQAVAEHGLDDDPALVRPVDPGAFDEAAVHELYAGGATAFVVHYASPAVEVRRTLEAAGRRVPQDCSLVTLNDPDGDAGEELTGLRLPREEMGAKAVALLLDKLTNVIDQGPRQVALPCHLVKGETIGPPPERRSES